MFILCLCSLNVNATSSERAQQIFNKLKSANHLYGPKLTFKHDDHIASYNRWLTVNIDPQWLSRMNDNEVAFVLGHELAHWYLIAESETRADNQSITFGKRAGFNVCQGAITFFNKIPQRGDKTHPHPQTRIKKLPC